MKVSESAPAAPNRRLGPGQINGLAPAVQASGSARSRDGLGQAEPHDAAWDVEEQALAALSSEAMAERRCPRCEAALWGLALPSGPPFFVRRPGQLAAGFLAALVGPELDLSAPDIDSFLRGADPLDRVEFLAEMEATSKRFTHRSGAWSHAAADPARHGAHSSVVASSRRAADVSL